MMMMNDGDVEKEKRFTIRGEELIIEINKSLELGNQMHLLLAMKTTQN